MARPAEASSRPGVLPRDTQFVDTSMAATVPLLDFPTQNIEQYEGCTDSVVWPGAASGPTIACGIDLGNIGRRNALEILEGLPDSVYREILKTGVGVRGKAASQAWIRRNQVHIGEHNAALLCGSMKRFVWRLAVEKYPGIDQAPASVKTGMLSVFVHVGVGSPRLAGVGSAIKAKRWKELASVIRRLGLPFAGTRYQSINARRANEALAIELELHPPKNVEVNYD